MESVIYVDSQIGRPLSRKTSHFRGRTGKKAPEIQSLLKARGAVSRQRTLDSDGEWMEDELDRPAYAGTGLSQPTGSGASFVTGVNEEIVILEAAHPA